MSQTTLLIKSNKGWQFHTVSNHTDNIVYLSKTYWFKRNAERDAKAHSQQIKSKYIPYEAITEMFL